MSRGGLLWSGLGLCGLWLLLWALGGPQAAGGLAGLVGTPFEQLVGIAWVLVRPLVIVFAPPILLCALFEHALLWRR